MFCRKCGARIDGSGRFCGSCGAVVEQQAQTAPIQTDAYAHTAAQPNKKVRNKTIGIIVCALAAVLVLVGVIAAFSKTETPDVVVEKYLNALLAFDYDEICKYSAIDYETYINEALTYASLFSSSDDRQYLLDTYGMTDIKKIFQEVIKEEIVEYLKDNYGRDYVIDVSISGSTELTKSEMNKQIEAFRTDFNSYVDADTLVPLNKVKAMCSVRGRMSIEGSYDDDSETFEVYCVKIGGKWKVLCGSDMDIPTFGW